MGNIKTRWLVYTVLVALIPMLCRLLVWGMLDANNVNWIDASDCIAFGIIVHISSINEVEHLDDKQGSWKTIINGTSIAFITIYGVLFALNVVEESDKNLLKDGVLLYLVSVLAIISFVIGFAVFHRLQYVSAREPK